MIIPVFLNKFPPNSLNVFASVSSIYLPCHSLEFDSYRFSLYTLNPYKDWISVLFFCQFICYLCSYFRYQTDRENLLQMIYMIIAGYFKDDTSDELTNDPVFKAVLNKGTLITTDHFKIS